MKETDKTLSRLAREVASQLDRGDWRLVLAESCTAGRIAAVLGEVPGISQRFCGSAVVYRERTKQDWLGVPAAEIDQHSAVSPQVTTSLARGVLRRTPEATLSLGVTGHLGPDVPPALDGQVHVALCRRTGRELAMVVQKSWRLESDQRGRRQTEATLQSLVILRDYLDSPEGSGTRDR